MILSYNQQEGLERGYFPTTDTYVIVRLECHGTEILGEFRHLYVKDSEEFNSISEFIYKLELMLEQMNVPQSTTNCRKGWGDPQKCKHGDDTIAPKREWRFLEEPSMIGMGKPGWYFLLHIRYRCNSSWQGEIRWLRKNCTMIFRSVLELLMVLENTMIEERAAL